MGIHQVFAGKYACHLRRQHTALVTITSSQGKGYLTTGVDNNQMPKTKGSKHSMSTEDDRVQLDIISE